jgi:hypothetical protein
LAHPADHFHIRAQSRGGYGLVSAFATWKSLKITTQKSFSWSGVARRAHYQVHIDTAYNDDFTHLFFLSLKFINMFQLPMQTRRQSSSDK